MPTGWLRHAHLATELIQQYAAGGQPLLQRRELAFQLLGGFRVLGPQSYRQARFAQLQFALHRAQRRQVQREAQGPALAAFGRVVDELQLHLQHVAAVLALQRNLDHPGGQRAGVQLRHFHPRQRGLDVAVQPVDQRLDIVVAGKLRQRQPGLRLDTALQQRRRRVAAVGRGRCGRALVEQAGQAQQGTFPVILGQRRMVALRLRQPRFEEQPALVDRLAQAFAAGNVRRRADGLFKQGQRRAQGRRQLAHHGPLRQCAQRGQQRCVAILLWQPLAQRTLDGGVGGRLG